jgi:hypothetical protein
MRTVAPRATLASEPEAPEMVAAAIPAPLGVELYCKVEPVASFAVWHTDTRSTMMIGPFAIVKIVLPFTMTAVAEATENSGACDWGAVRSDMA